MKNTAFMLEVMVQMQNHGIKDAFFQYVTKLSGYNYK